jgi:peptide/nickel transport system substrate-binding protein
MVGIWISLGGVVFGASKKTTLIIATPTDPRNISPVSASTFLDWAVGHHVYSSLLQADANFRPVPDLAASWDVSPDFLTYTFHLKQGATFHDGTPITAQDVAYSVMQINVKHGSICSRGLATVIDVVETPDDHTVIFRLKKPYPEMLNPYDGLGSHCSAVLKKALYEGTDVVTNPANYKPVGSGPFQFVEWVRGSHIVLERYPKYYDTPPEIERIVIRVIPDPMARALAFENGEVDWIPFEAPRSEVERLDALAGNNVFFHGTPCGATLELGFNLRQEPFSNKVVRKALTAAINKEKIANLVYFGGADVAHGHVAPTPFSEWWHDVETKQIAYDPKRAMQMLEEAGYPAKGDGWRLHLTLKHSTGFTEHIKVAELIKDDFKKIGVDLNIVSLDNAAWHDHVFKNWDFEVALLPFCSGPTPPSLKRFHTENILKISWANSVGFSHSGYDSLFDRMISETDQKKRVELVYQMQKILVEEQPLTFLVHTKSATAIKEGLFTENPQNVWTLGYLWMHLNNVKPIAK